MDVDTYFIMFIKHSERTPNPGPPRDPFRHPLLLRKRGWFDWQRLSGVVFF